MRGLRSRVGAAFLVPAERPPAVPADAAPPAPAPAVATGTDAQMAVLSRPADAWVAGGAIALAMLGAGPARAGVVAVWAAARPRLQAPAATGARRLAARLSARGHDACATGRLVLVVLGDPGEGARVAAAAGDAPVVRVFAGARDDAVDRELDAGDRVVVAAAEGDDAIAGLAAAAFGARGRLIRLQGPAAARAAVTTGVGLVAPLRSVATEAVA